MNINTDFIAAIHNHLQQLRRLHAKSIRGKPWFVLLGPSRAGKTSFLRHAELNVQHVLTPDDPIIQTWICDNALFIDIQTRTINPNELLQTWEALATTFRENKAKLHQGGLILSLPLHDLMNQTKLQRDVLIGDYKNIAVKLADAAGHSLAIYTVFTQCDRIAGFSEFFNDLDRTQRQMPCGFLLKSPSAQFEHEFNDEFDLLLKNLHASLIQKLHRVHNPQERARINDFALQFESIKELITDAIAQFNQTDNLVNRGCFFVSNLQDGLVEDRLSKSLEQTFTLKADTTPVLAFTANAYFTNQIAARILPTDQVKPVTAKVNTAWFSSLSAHVLTVGLSGSLFIAMTATYLHQRHLIQYTNLQLAEYQTHKPILGSKLTPAEMRTMIDSLNQLQQTETTLQRSSYWWPNLFPTSLQRTTQQFEKVYQQELSQELYSRFASYIDHTLTDMGDQDPDAIYNALKAYLMLGSSDHRESTYLINWLSHHLEISDISEKLAPMFANNGVGSVSLNQETVDEARQFLSGLPPAMLGIVMLRSQSDATAINSVPHIFTKKGYKKTVDSEIPAIAAEVFAGDWVLGKVTVSHDISITALTDDIRKQYPAEYVKWWQQFLVSASLPPIHSLEEAVSALHKITDAQTRLVSMMEQLRQETSAMIGTDPISVQFNKEIASQFTEFDAGSYQHLGSLNSHFKELSTALDNIAHSTDQNAAAFQFAKETFRSNSQSGLTALISQSAKLPSPLDLWVTQVVDECWQVILPKAEAHLEALWHAQVVSEYTHSVEGKYPLAQQGRSELALSDFNRFFSPHGIIASFYSQHLAAFINTDSPTWKTRQIGALEFPLSPKLLETLVRAKLIRQMFFPNDSAETKISFKLTPLRLDPIIKDLVMDIDGQALYASPGSTQTVHLTWPGPRSTGQINLIFNNIDGSKSFVTDRGPWSWFRLLNKLDVQRMGSPQEFQVTFNLNGNMARYQLSADTVVNPYLANIVTGFNLPNDLFSREETA